VVKWSQKAVLRFEQRSNFGSSFKQLDYNDLICIFFVGPIKRFYKDVNIISNDDGYEIGLDGRKIKTPLNNILKVNSLSLANMIANEWRSQRDLIKKHEMLLTNIAFTAIDNPQNMTKEEMIDQLTEWLYTDTLCFRIKEPVEMKSLQEQRYDPILDWLRERYNCEVPISDNIMPPDIPVSTQNKLKQIFNFNQASLFGLTLITENLKSLILTIALINQKISISEAVSLSRLELEYQTRVWGSVEWAHDLEKNLITATVASALIFFLSNSESTKVVKKGKL